MDIEEEYEVYDPQNPHVYLTPQIVIDHINEKSLSKNKTESIVRQDPTMRKNILVF